MLGGSVSLAGLTSVNDDAVLLVGLFSILGPALAVAVAVAAARVSLRNTMLVATDVMRLEPDLLAAAALAVGNVGVGLLFHHAITWAWRSARTAIDPA